MEIQIRMDCPIPGLDDRKIRVKAKRALEDLGCHDKELSLLFTTDETIARLNEQYRGREGATDVLSFALMEGTEPALFESVMLGDVVISVDTALREAKELGQSLERTVDQLLIHGILHLLGFDHEKSSEDAGRMAKEEKRLLARLGVS